MKKLKSHRCFGGLTEFFEHGSNHTKTQMKFCIHRPSESKPIKGGLIWLSGLTCTDENFITKAGAQRFCEDLGLAIICPDTSPRGLDLPNEHESYDFGSGAGFYLDATTEYYKNHYNMYSYVNEEVYDLFNKELNLNGNIGIFGHSMGGHGALTIGLKNPDKYKSISAFSPIVNPMNSAWGKKAFKNYLGEDESTWEDYDACKLVEKGNFHSKSILIDQGLTDDFYPDQLLTKNFEEICGSKQNLKVNYRKDFDHSYYFISTFIEEHMKHHSESLK